MSDEEPLTIAYELRFADGEVVRIEVRLEPRTLEFLRQGEPQRPPWTQLAAVGCADCPLDPQQHTHCPVAVSLVELVEKFRQRLSHDAVELTVTTAQRQVRAATSLQAALSSLTGIYMVTNGCPVMDKLRPMVRFHLPLADLAETTYRAASMYLLAQFLRAKRGLPADSSLKGLEEIYRAVHQVNMAMARAIRRAAKLDASANALVRLDLFTEGMTFSLQAALDDLEYLFERVYLTP